MRAHDDTKYLCQNNVVFTVGAPPEKVSDLDDNGNLTSEAQAKYYNVEPEDSELQAQFAPDYLENFNKEEKANAFKAELNMAEEEIPTFDLTNTDKCTICGAFTTDKYICKTKKDQKMWLAVAGERLKWGLSYTRRFDEDANEFIASTDINCE